MKTAGHDGVLVLKVKRFEISLNNCKVYILPNSIALLIAVCVRQVLPQFSC